MPEVGLIALGDNVVYTLPLEAGGVLLIDAGPDYDFPGGEPTWDSMIAQAGALDFTPEDVRGVLITHGHIDHAGLAAHWARTGARILVDAHDLPVLTQGRAANEVQRELRLAELRRHGCPELVIQALAELRGSRGLRWEPCPEDAIEAVPDGMTMALEDGFMLEVIAAPGHTPGNLVGYVAESGDLFSGDTLLPTTLATPGLHFPAALRGDEGESNPERWPSLPPFMRSVARLRTLDLERILPGHGHVVDDPQRLFDQFERHHTRRAARVREALVPGSLTAFEIVRALFPRLPSERIGQAMTEIIGHLDLLEEQAAVAVEERHGIRQYRLVG